MGSTAANIENESALLCGEQRWFKHKETVARFWENLAHYFDSLDATNLKIYQDGLAADGELGMRIIQEGAKRGSNNYQLILKLVKKGAEVRKTEALPFLKEEYKYITELAQPKTAVEKARLYVRCKRGRERLMGKRDRFIASMINETLKEGEVGVLFIGSYHDVAPYLSKDIVVEQVKERERVNAYFEELISRGEGERFEQLAKYLASPGTP